MAVSPDDLQSWDSTPWQRSFNSFSGCDILLMLNGIPIAEAQGITYTIQREKVPLYIMGRVDPIQYSRGKRGIAGSMVYLTFDRAALAFSMRNQAQYWARLEEVYTFDSANTQEKLNETNREKLLDNFSLPTGVVVARANYADQIPPFNVVLVAANEYGGGATMSIVGAEIVNDGSSISIDDPVIDQSMTYVARRINSWEPLKFVDPRDKKVGDLSQAANFSGVDEARSGLGGNI